MFDDRPTEKLAAKIAPTGSDVQASRPAIGRATLWFPRALAGYDVDELDARAAAAVEPAYRWWGAR